MYYNKVYSFYKRKKASKAVLLTRNRRRGPYQIKSLEETYLVSAYTDHIL